MSITGYFFDEYLEKKIFSLLLLSIIFSIVFMHQFLEVNAQEDSAIIELSFTPPVIESGANTYPIGNVMILDRNGGPALAPEDITIKIESDNTSLVSVPNVVTISKDEQSVNFDVTVKEGEGIVEISAILDEQVKTQELRIGGTNIAIPIGVDLRINMPVNSTLVNTNIPISVFLDNNGTILQAPKDILVKLEYEESLIRLEKEEITIKKGDYYATVIVNILENTGNAFIKASSNEPPLSNVESIAVTSALPAQLKVFVYPKHVIKVLEREIDIFVALLDSDGNPTVPRSRRYSTTSVCWSLTASSSAVGIIKIT